MLRKSPLRRDNGEDSDPQRGEADQPDPGQALRDRTEASAAAALPEAEGKKTTDTTRGKSPSESEPSCLPDRWIFLSPLSVESSDRIGWLASVSSLAC